MERYHSLDKLRAAMMLLGIWLHTVVGYSRHGGWPYKDPNPTAAFDWTLGIIHAFRMPLFMTLAGFFGALLWTRRGPTGFVGNRLQRVLLPFALGWIAVIPGSIFLAAWSKTGSAAAAAGFFTSGAFVQHLHPGHLWFLEYLLVLYALTGAAAFLASRVVPSVLRAKANAVYRRALACRWRPVLFAVPSALALCTMPGGFLQDPPGFVPVPRIVLAYLAPFAFGWLLYRNRDMLPTFQSGALVQVGLAAALAAAHILALAPYVHRALPAYATTLNASVGALFLWLLTFGLTGLFLRHASGAHAFGRYLSDASYWIYLVHMPVVIVGQMALRSVAIPSEAKVLLVVAASCLVLIASYDLLARPTWIGALLNGRRHPRRYSLRRAASAPTGRPVAVDSQAA